MRELTLEEIEVVVGGAPITVDLEIPRTLLNMTRPDGGFFYAQLYSPAH